MQYLSRNDLRQIADLYLKGYEKKVSRGLKPVRIVPDILAAELLNLNVSRFHLSKDGSVLGMTAFTPLCIDVWDDAWQQCFFSFGEGDILIETSLSKDSGRYNFTVMHEIAHQIIHRRFSERTPEAVHRYERLSRNNFDWEEWQADTLASYLLLPESVIRNALHLVRAENGFTLLDPNLYGREYRMFCDAAELLGVTKSALKIRLMQLRLLRYDNVEQMVDIWKEDDEVEWKAQIAS